MRFGVVVFPGSNCDHDAWYAVSKNLGQQAEFIWHDSTNLNNLDAVILPGGFAYGDYLRCVKAATSRRSAHSISSKTRIASCSLPGQPQRINARYRRDLE